MSHTERGIYITLLCLCWSEGSLPAAPAQLAKMVAMPSARFAKIWPGPLSQCFQPSTEGRITNKRLEAERQKQADFRRRQSDNGVKGGRPTKAVGSENETQNNPSLSQTERVGFAKKSSSSSSASAISDLPKASEAPPTPRGTDSGRIYLHRWQIEELISTLGPHAENFALDAWIDGLTAEANRQGLTLPKESRWPWVQAELTREIQRRQLPIGTGGADSDWKAGAKPLQRPHEARR